MPRRSDFGQFMRLCRESLGYSLRKVAELSREEAAFERITPANLAMIERGRHIPSFAKVLTLSRIYVVPLRLFEEHYWRSMDEQPGQGPVRGMGALLEEGWQLYGVGKVACALSRFRDALSARSGTLRMAPMRTEARLGQALCELACGQLLGAREGLETLFGDPAAGSAVKARVGLALSQIHRTSGNLALLRLYAGEALRWARRAGEPEITARSLYAIADADHHESRTEKARKRFQKVLALSPRPSALQAAAWRRIAHCVAECGGTVEAEELFSKAMEIAASLGLSSEAARNQLDLAALLIGQRRLAEARTHARSGLLSARGLGEKALEYRALHLLRYVAGQQEDWSREREYRRSLLLLERKFGSGGRWAPSGYCPLEGAALRPPRQPCGVRPAGPLSITATAAGKAAHTDGN